MIENADRIKLLRDSFAKLYENKTFLKLMKLMKLMDENLNSLDWAAHEIIRREQTASYQELVESLR